MSSAKNKNNDKTGGSYYQSSKAFGVLKKTKERLQTNLTTSQYLQIYDEYLEKAIIPILNNTSLFDTFLIAMLGWQEKNYRRKISFLKRVEFPRVAINFFLARTPKERIKSFKELRLDRGAKIEFIKTFHSKLSDYLKACDGTLSKDLEFCYRVKASVESSFECGAASLLGIYRESNFWLKHALDFKQTLLEKYIRLALNAAKSDYTNFFNYRVPLDDVVQHYVLATSRAIDKCDSRQGALTSHIQFWFYSARESLKKSLADPTLEKSCEQIDFDQLPNGDADPIVSDALANEAVDLIAQLARLADPLGVGRVLLDIPNVITEKERQLLESNVVKTPV